MNMSVLLKSINSVKRNALLLCSCMAVCLCLSVWWSGRMMGMRAVIRIKASNERKKELNQVLSCAFTLGHRQADRGSGFYGKRM